MYIKRHLEDKLSSLIQEWPCVIVTGPRQVGKSTMIKNVVGDNFNYVTFDDLEIRMLAKADPKLFLQLNKPPLVIDEVQYVPEIFSYIKMMIDNNNIAGQFILTGSQSYKMMQGVEESLAGRTALLTLQGISVSEQQGRINSSFEANLQKLIDIPNYECTVQTIFEGIKKGTMPAIISGERSNVEDYYSAYINTYLQKDIKDIDNNINSMKFYKFMIAAAARVGQIVNYSDIARDSDITEKLAKDWINVLERIGILFQLYPYSNNLLKRTLKKPKLYFYDSGLAVYLTKWNSIDALINGSFAGSIFENYVVSEVSKSYLYQGSTTNMYYYRDTDGYEIDIILEQNGEICPIEIKKNIQPDGKKIYKQMKVLDKGSIKRGIGAVICMTDKLSAYNNELLIIPITKI